MFEKIRKLRVLLVTLLRTLLNNLSNLPTTQGQNNNKSAKENKVIVITGCDSGLGLEVSKYALEWGYYVVACCLDTSSNGAQLLTELKADITLLNVCNRELAAKLVQKLSNLQEEGKVIWCLINNAGIMSYAKAEWLTWDLVQSQLLVNLSGTIQMTRCLLPFIRQSEGRIINVSSPQGMISSPYMSVYCSSKSGIEAFSKAVRRENSPHGVKVVVVRPCNFPHKTSILKQNSQNLKTMKKEMSSKTITDFGDEIEAVQKTFEVGFSTVNANQDINDYQLIESFRLAIELPFPARTYTAAPLIVRLLLNALTLLPESLMDWLVLKDIPTKIIDLGKTS